MSPLAVDIADAIVAKEPVDQADLVELGEYAKWLFNAWMDFDTSAFEDLPGEQGQAVNRAIDEASGYEDDPGITVAEAVTGELDFGRPLTDRDLLALASYVQRLYRAFCLMSEVEQGDDADPALQEAIDTAGQFADAPNVGEMESSMHGPPVGGTPHRE